MNLIVDTNVIDVVFNPSHLQFSNFEPILTCLLKKNGKMFYGGKKFKSEIGSKIVFKFRGIFTELRNKGKLIELDERIIDAECSRLKRIEPCTRFNDEHIIACAILCSAKIICTNDRRADIYLKDRRFYPQQMQIPKIYRNKKYHKRLLNSC
jgi:rRNA-processing protein FCF1